MAAETRIAISSDMDVVTARQTGRRLAAAMGFSRTDQTMIATAISELARNILEYASRGEIIVAETQKDNRRGIVITARDRGPGIPDVALAMQDGYSTGQGLGMGLPGTQRLTDEFDIRSEIGEGTTITAKKWL